MPETLHTLLQKKREPLMIFISKKCRHVHTPYGSLSRKLRGYATSAYVLLNTITIFFTVLQACP